MLYSRVNFWVRINNILKPCYGSATQTVGGQVSASEIRCPHQSPKPTATVSARQNVNT